MKKECKKCGKCCMGTMGPIVFPSDIESICRFLRISHQEFYKVYCQKYELHVKSKEVILYAIKKVGKGCAFLNHCLCDIYQVRPYQCRMAPYNFLTTSGLWGHMECLDKQMLEKRDSSEMDKEVFKKLLHEKYL